VLQQAKKKAALRVRGGRARPIDWLAVTLRFIDPTEKNILDEEVEDHELEVVDPEGVLEGLGNEDLSELEKEIENYLALETNRSNRDYWNVSSRAILYKCYTYTHADTPSRSKPYVKTSVANQSHRPPKPEAPAPSPPTSTSCSRPRRTNSSSRLKCRSKRS
jgi:hypothetical protein